MKKEVVIALLLILVLPLCYAQDPTPDCDRDPECWPKTQTCGCGGQQERYTLCDGGCSDWYPCSAPTTETGCGDGTDDDCDGLTDCDDPDCGQSNQCLDSDNDGYPRINDCNDFMPGINPGAQEICNNRDDNCNTLIDDGLQQECGVNNLGICTLGVEQCVAGDWIGCTAILPTTETCDGLDNNCDGNVDEGCSCTTGETRSCGSDIGRCQVGTQTCSAGAWGACAGSTGPTAEECGNNIDDDCDGQTDEDCELPEPQQITPPAQQTQPTQPTTPTQPERPKGEPLLPTRPCIDNDNDGYGIDCKAGQDCDDTDPENHFNNAEVCDGKDNNCDNRVDEALTRACGTSRGICREGQERCQNGEWTGCTATKPEAQETCGNYQDDNCNGMVDENCPGQESKRDELLLKAFLDQEFGAENYNLDEMLAAYRETKDNFDVKKSSQTKDGKTEITVTVKAKQGMKDVTIYEYIPKDVAQTTDHIKFYIEPKIITKDPLVAWHFAELTDEVEIRYEVEGEQEKAHEKTNTIALSHNLEEKQELPWYMLLLPIIIIPAAGFIFILLIQLSKKHKE